MKTHEQVEEIQCDKCDKTFSLKWRLMQHEKMHESSNRKWCHYFNNQKPCPFEEIGCMFQHADAAHCKFQDNCTRKMCPFKHESNGNDKDDQTAIVIENVEMVSEEFDEELKSDNDSEQEECDTCERIFKNNLDLNEHHRNDNCGFECNVCGEYYMFENDLKLHQKRNCM